MKTFRLVAQCLKQLRHRVPQILTATTLKSSHIVISGFHQEELLRLLDP
jgi:hypothetical protein